MSPVTPTQVPVKRRCFVIMPLSLRTEDLPRYGNDENHWSEVYEGLIRPAAERAGLECERDDEDIGSRLIIDHIWRKVEGADVILCDLSSSNPNVHLELGWALRADKKFVLLKDDLTPFQFDLNQFYTHQYSHRLQPRLLRRSVEELSRTLERTLSDTDMRYSMVSKLSLGSVIIREAAAGNVEASMLHEILDYVRRIDTTRGPSGGGFAAPTQKLRARSQSDLAKKIVGTTWRKRNAIETVHFRNQPVFLHNNGQYTNWTENRYSLEVRPETGHLGHTTMN